MNLGFEMANIGDLVMAILKQQPEKKFTARELAQQIVAEIDSQLPQI